MANNFITNAKQRSLKGRLPSINQTQPGIEVPVGSSIFPVGVNFMRH